MIKSVQGSPVQRIADLPKPFMEYGPTGYDTYYTADQLLNLSDEDAGKRLAVVLFKRGFITGQDLLDVLSLRGRDISFVDGK